MRVFSAATSKSCVFMKVERRGLEGSVVLGNSLGSLFVLIVLVRSEGRDGDAVLRSSCL